MTRRPANVRISAAPPPADPSPHQALIDLLLSSSDPAAIAPALLDASTAVVGCQEAALLLATQNPAVFETVASRNAPRFPVGRRLDASTRPPKGAFVLPLRAGGDEFGRILLLKTGPVSSTKRAELERLTLQAVVLRSLTESEALRNRLAETNAIVEVGQVLTGLLAMEDVLSYVVYLAESLVRGNCAAIALRGSDTGDLVLRNSTGSLRAVEGQTIPIDGSLMGWVVESGQPVVTPSVSDDPRGFALESRQGPGLVVPVQINGETIGSFLVARLDGGQPFSEENLATLQKMSAYAAIAIHNAQLYRDQMDAATTLREQAGELQEAYSELNKQQDQLIVSEKMAALGRITAGIAHEINSPLGSIMNAVRTAKGYVDEYRASIADPEITAADHEAIAGDILSALTLAENASAKVAQFVRSIKTQTRPGEGQRSAFDPAAEIDATIVLLQHRLKHDNAAVYSHLERGLTLTGDQGKFAVVVQNLISNALDAYEGKPPEVWLRLFAEEGAIRLEVEDHGSGIPEAIRGHIFDFLFTTKDVGKGTGLGLAMVHSVVTGDFEGEIELRSQVGEGTTFSLVFPLNRIEE